MVEGGRDGGGGSARVGGGKGEELGRGVGRRVEDDGCIEEWGRGREGGMEKGVGEREEGIIEEEWRREPGRGMGKRKESRRKRGGWRSEGKERQSSRSLLWLVLSLVQAARGTSPLLITA